MTESRYPQGHLYYDKQGEPIDLMTWAGLVEDPEYARVALDEVDLYVISTVWLGIDHNFYRPGGPPYIFETMVFLEGSAEDMSMWRYPTEAAALAGHEATCAEIRERDRQVAEEHAMPVSLVKAEPEQVTRRMWLTIRAVATGTSLFNAVEAVATTALAHPEWDMDELRTGAEWAAGERAPSE
jgi:hypothetical protein